MFKYYTIVIIFFLFNVSLSQNRVLTYKGIEEFPIFNNYHILYFADSANNIYHIISKKHFNNITCDDFNKLVIGNKYKIDIYPIDKNNIPQLTMSFRNYGIEGKFKEILIENRQILIDIYLSSNLIDTYYLE